MGNECGEIENIETQLVFKEEVERFNAETKMKNKRHFGECCEASGSEAVGFPDDKDDDTLHCKKLKVM